MNFFAYLASVVFMVCISGCAIGPVEKTEEQPIEISPTEERIYVIYVTYSEHEEVVYGGIFYSKSKPMYIAETSEYRFIDMEGREWLVPGLPGWAVAYELYR